MLNVVKTREKESLSGNSWKRDGGREMKASSSISRDALAEVAVVSNSPEIIKKFRGKTRSVEKWIL